MNTPEFETLDFPFGPAKRRYAPITSPTLLTLPEALRPKPIVGCTTCPDASWYHDETSLKCHCKAHRYVSWLPRQAAVALCDEREAALLEQLAAGNNEDPE